MNWRSVAKLWTVWVMVGWGIAFILLAVFFEYARPGLLYVPLWLYLCYRMRVQIRLAIWSLGTDCHRGRKVVLFCMPKSSPWVIANDFVNILNQSAEMMAQKLELRSRPCLSVFLLPSLAEFQSRLGCKGDGFSWFWDVVAVTIDEKNACIHGWNREASRCLARTGNPLAPSFWVVGTVGNIAAGAIPVSFQMQDRAAIQGNRIYRAMVRRVGASDFEIRVAISFAKYIIRRFSWESYLTYFKGVNVINMRRRFKSVFGIEMSSAVEDWKCEVIGKMDG